MKSEAIYRRREASVIEKAGYLLIGAGAGAVLALLLAPKPGIELREDIADATRKGLERGRQTAAQIGERAGEYYDVTRERAGDLYDATRELTGDLVEQAREVATRPANTLSAAIEAGKRAYYEEKRRTESASLKFDRPTYPVEKIEKEKARFERLKEKVEEMPGNDKTPAA